MYENVCYKKPFLKDVILRLDFASRVEGFAKALPQRLATAALQRFPIAEPKKAQTREVTFSATALETKTEDSMQWVYHGRNREKTITITPEALIIQSKRYETYEGFYGDFEHVHKSLIQACDDLSTSRIGLRFINVIKLPDGDPLAWKDYINEDMLGIIDLHKDAGVLSRVFHVVGFNYDGQQVKFQFGIANPDYPAPIKRREFVLDIDSFFTGALTNEEIPNCIRLAHEKIQTLFEDSITAKTRQLMEPAEANDAK